MIQRPEPLTAEHALGGFGSGVASLDHWLRRRALHASLTVNGHATLLNWIWLLGQDDETGGHPT